MAMWYYLKGTSFCLWQLSLENSEDTYLWFNWFYAELFVLSILDKVPSVNSSANVFVFGGFKVHRKDWLTYPGGTDRPFEFCYNFLFLSNAVEIVNFHTRIPDWFSQACSLKLLSTIFYQIFISFQMIALQRLWKMFFISSKNFFSFSRYSNFYISIFPSFSPCQPLL